MTEHKLSTNQAEESENSRDELLLQVILKATTGVIGPDFFDTCVKSLALALGVESTFISMPMAERQGWNKLVAHWSRSHKTDLVEYEIAGTPCSVIASDGVAVFSEDVQRTFPDAGWLREVHAESYVALQLIGRHNQPLGHFGFVHDAPFNPTPSEMRRLRLIAAGIADRLEQLRLDLESQKQIDLRDKVLASGPFGAIHWDLLTGEAWGNDAFANIVGRTYQEAVALGWDQVLHPEDLERFDCALERLVTTGETFNETVRILRPDGERRWIQIHAVAALDADGKPTQITGLIVDQTEAKVANERLNESAQQHYLRNAELESSLNAFPDLRFRLSASGTCLSVWTGDPSKLLSPPEDIVGTNISQHFAEPLARRIRSAINDTVDTSEVQVVGYFLDQDDQRTYYEARLARLGSDEVMAVVRDVTDLKVLEQQLMHAETMQSVGRLAGGIAHDFNNVLHIVRGHASSLKGNLDDPHVVGRRVESIIRAVDRTTSLVDRLMAISRPSEDNPEPIAVDTFVETLAHTLSQLVGEQIALAFDLDTAGAAVLIDDSRFENIFFNIVTNARDAMPSGGTVTITTKRDQNNTVRIVISDTGAGIDASELQSVFEPFFTTKPLGVGTGLGLATAYTSIISAGGSIAIDSSPGEGTTLSIVLPEVEVILDAFGSAPLAEDGERTFGDTVLVVEDDEEVLALCAEALRELGCRVFEASTGEAALDLLDRETVSLVLTDIVMPKMTGLDLAERLSALHPSIPVIYMSGYASDSLTDQPPSTQRHILRKPFTDDSLRQVLSERLHPGRQ